MRYPICFIDRFYIHRAIVNIFLVHLLQKSHLVVIPISRHIQSEIKMFRWDTPQSGLRIF